ncbi:N-acetylneuraminate synthase family protein [Aliifodinibius salicampi]|uniref:N-acetylneuraminate synthase family protein n=1 Tax=Fodinibius salicampi TaxID=1920655 RepID=A0ABT3PYY3_9BACT|nr:N-acetylneuraminate synthase family protein [Fodinibius salicampi]MCW9713065.1 N-acetylneuraminate synthase family protein [Fodinibius salicampi]
MLPQNEPYLIGETAFHHEGDIDFLRDLIAKGAEAGIDAIKCHLLFDINDYMIDSHKALKKLGEMCLLEDQWDAILDLIQKKNIDPIFLCNDVASFDWVIQNDDQIQAAEIHATGINDVFLLEKAAEFRGTIILGTGGSTIDEIKFAVDFLKKRDQNDIFLMHGFQNYPTDYRDVIFSKMDILNEVFELPVGYADHTDPEDELNEYISCLPQSSGYNILEKHFTSLPNEERIDSQAAVSVDRLKTIRELMDTVWLTNGIDDPLKMSQAEQKYGDVGPMKKALVARNDLEKGTEVAIEDIAYKRTNNSVPVEQNDIYNFIGAKTVDYISKDTPLTYNNIEYRFRKGDTSQFKLDED